MTTMLATTAEMAATRRGAFEPADELAMTVAVCSATTVFVSVIRVMTPRLLTAPVLELAAAELVVPVMRNILDPSSWFAVMIDLVLVVEGAAELSVFVPEVAVEVDSAGEEEGAVRVDEEGYTTRVVSAVKDEAVRVEVEADAVTTEVTSVVTTRAEEAVPEVDAVPEDAVPEDAVPEDEVTITSVPEREGVSEATADEREPVAEEGRTPLSVAEEVGGTPEPLAEEGEAVGGTDPEPEDVFQGVPEGVLDGLFEGVFEGVSAEDPVEVPGMTWPLDVGPDEGVCEGFRDGV